nr:hypothetical protein Iba_chr04fCG15430 [Ipomoea batatas]
MTVNYPVSNSILFANSRRRASPARRLNQPYPRSLSLWVNRILLRVDSSRFAKSKESPHRQLSIRFLPLRQYDFTLRFPLIIIPEFTPLCSSLSLCSRIRLGLGPLVIR